MDIIATIIAATIFILFMVLYGYTFFLMVSDDQYEDIISYLQNEMKYVSKEHKEQYEKKVIQMKTKIHKLILKL